MNGMNEDEKSCSPNLTHGRTHAANLVWPCPVVDQTKFLEPIQNLVLDLLRHPVAGHGDAKFTACVRP